MARSRPRSGARVRAKCGEALHQIVDRVVPHLTFRKAFLWGVACCRAHPLGLRSSLALGVDAVEIYVDLPVSSPLRVEFAADVHRAYNATFATPLPARADHTGAFLVRALARGTTPMGGFWPARETTAQIVERLAAAFVGCHPSEWRFLCAEPLRYWPVPQRIVAGLLDDVSLPAGCLMACPHCDKGHVPQQPHGMESHGVGHWSVGRPRPPARCGRCSGTGKVPLTLGRDACPSPESWRLATIAYRERDFSALGALADSLEEAGCMRADLLAHLRSPGPHTRGCWALDLILGCG